MREAKKETLEIRTRRLSLVSRHRPGLARAGAMTLTSCGWSCRCCPSANAEASLIVVGGWWSWKIPGLEASSVARCRLDSLQCRTKSPISADRRWVVQSPPNSLPSLHCRGGRADAWRLGRLRGRSAGHLGRRVPGRVRWSRWWDDLRNRRGCPASRSRERAVSAETLTTFPASQRARSYPPAGQLMRLRRWRARGEDRVCCSGSRSLRPWWNHSAGAFGGGQSLARPALRPPQHPAYFHDAARWVRLWRLDVSSSCRACLYKGLISLRASLARRRADSDITPRYKSPGGHKTRHNRKSAAIDSSNSWSSWWSNGSTRRGLTSRNLLSNNEIIGPGLGSGAPKDAFRCRCRFHTSAWVIHPSFPLRSRKPHPPSLRHSSYEPPVETPRLCLMQPARQLSATARSELKRTKINYL